MVEQLSSVPNLNAALDRIYDIMLEHNVAGVVILSDGTENSCKLVKLDAPYSLVQYDGMNEDGNPEYLFDTHKATVGEFQKDAESTFNIFSGVAYSLLTTSEMLTSMHKAFESFVNTVVERVHFKSSLSDFTKNSN